MKNITIKLMIILFAISGLMNSVLAQAPEGIIYQAEARDGLGQPIINQALDVKISIIQDDKTGFVVYEEFHQKTTNDYGMFDLVIGDGTNKLGLFENIDWGNHIHFLNVQVKKTTETVWIDMGTSQLLSVPYALYAKTAENLSNDEKDPVFLSSPAYGINSDDITKLSNLSGVNTGDQDLSDLASKTDLHNKVDKVAGKDLFPKGTAPGQMKYWNGSEWVNVVPGQTGQTLIYLNGVPAWMWPSQVASEVANLKTGSLKLPVAGVNFGSTGSPGNLGSNGFNWSNKLNSASSDPLFFDKTGFSIEDYQLNNGYSGVYLKDPLITNSILTVTTAEVINVKSIPVIAAGLVIANGNTYISVRGICWGTAKNPTIDLQTKTQCGNGAGLFTSTIIDLAPLTTYYLRAYATDINGTTYGNEVSFTTISMLTVTTAKVTNIKSNTVTMGGSVTANYHTYITERGVCWSKDNNPTIDLPTKTTGGNGAGSFSNTISGLTPLTTYYVRAYATDKNGTTYGNEVSFTAASPNGDNAGNTFWEKTGDGIYYRKGKIYTSDIQLKETSKILFEDNGWISTKDEMHSILFNRDENKMDFRESGKIVFSSGVKAGVENPVMVLDKVGNVGIGTSTPMNKLHVSGDIALGIPLANRMFIIHSQPGSDQNGDILAITGDNGKVGDAFGWSWDKAIQYYRKDGSLTINGNVGINGSELFFKDNGQIRSKDEKHRILFRREDNIMELREYGKIVFSSGATDGKENPVMVLDNVGNVGIGTSTPANRLHVAGDIALGKPIANQMFVIHSRTGEGQKGELLAITCDNGKDGLEWKWDWDKAIQYYRKDGNLTIKGNVGIGTEKLDSLSRLTVNGKIFCEGLEVGSIPDADFVFDANYKLRSLKDLEFFVKKNKHLPDIPSAQEYKDKGSYNLSEFDTKILQKVEELTLYIIQLKKENEQLKSQINTLKN
jgi:hypothetical protein